MKIKREDVKMSSHKKIAVVVVTIAALSLGSTGIASAHPRGEDKRVAHSWAHDAKHAAKQAAHDAHHAAIEALITATIGLDAATIKSRLKAGESLAAIAGVKKDALISALVTFKTKEIDARVAAGKLTVAQATTIKADLTAHVTAKVNAVRGDGIGRKDGKGPKGPKGMRP
jgi:hypothetical protein